MIPFTPTNNGNLSNQISDEFYMCDVFHMVNMTHLNAEWPNFTGLFINVRVNPIQGSSAIVKVLLGKKRTCSLK